jgi:hypothetical protein
MLFCNYVTIYMSGSLKIPILEILLFPSLYGGEGGGMLLGEVVIFSRRGVWCGVGWGGGLR